MINSFGEWNFAKKVFELINEQGIAMFKIDEEHTSNVGPFAFQGRVIDEEGNVYYIDNDESATLFKHLMVEHSLELSFDNIRKEISLKPQNEE